MSRMSLVFYIKSIHTSSLLLEKLHKLKGEVASVLNGK